VFSNRSLSTDIAAMFGLFIAGTLIPFVLRVTQNKQQATIWLASKSTNFLFVKAASFVL
jgi:hypothetical protein